jgi:hypothetical protein
VETATKKVGKFTAKLPRQNVWKNAKKVLDSDRQWNSRTIPDQVNTGVVKVKNFSWHQKNKTDLSRNLEFLKNVTLFLVSFITRLA